MVVSLTLARHLPALQLGGPSNTRHLRSVFRSCDASYPERCRKPCRFRYTHVFGSSLSEQDLTGSGWVAYETGEFTDIDNSAGCVPGPKP